MVATEADLKEPLLRIHDPNIITKLRGCRHTLSNSKLPIPPYLKVEVTEGVEVLPPLPPLPSQGYSSLKPSIRRSLTQAEIEMQTSLWSRSGSPAHTPARIQETRRGQARGTRAGVPSTSRQLRSSRAAAE
ncbi:hypothetical protein BGZ61DRAFT_147320 [Ilyonectria robusta]|uniref:uncharacterized protein n=1 Tax=Ilyonectria robusta TaxID=1079257 RepID=UPI001E8CEE91|nr:uncharacterized protein BGZ61DRAFT_147320 [Ilyonectria robusta]KAH8661715.1 hypothetical protein BGZ61DRAFT_147320 [Ilyonectria robusta]